MVTFLFDGHSHLFLNITLDGPTPALNASIDRHHPSLHTTYTLQVLWLPMSPQDVPCPLPIHDTWWALHQPLYKTLQGVFFPSFTHFIQLPICDTWWTTNHPYTQHLTCLCPPLHITLDWKFPYKWNLKL